MKSGSHSHILSFQQHRKIIHIDMDCFYAAVEVKKNPLLKNKPLGIGGSAEDRSVLCTASYEARKFGVRAAMPSSLALKKCPSLILIPPDFESYKRESMAIRNIFSRYTNLIEPLSLDEAYLDVTECTLYNGSATLIAQAIRNDIFVERHLTASAGIATNKFLSKIASDWNKPNGQFVIPPALVSSFIRDLPIDKIFGVGPVTAKKLKSLNIHTCLDIQKCNSLLLQTHFGDRAKDLILLAHGIDTRPVTSDEVRKSLTVENTYSQDLIDLESCLNRVPELYHDWALRFDHYKSDYQIKNITVKIKYHDFKSATHDKKLKDFPEIQDFQELLTALWFKNTERPVRLLGLGVHLEPINKLKDTDIESQLAFDIT